jgi:hypothetical protein
VQNSGNTLAGVNPVFGKYDAQGDPAIAPYRGGIFYFSFIDFDRDPEHDGQNRLAVAKSMDGGVTWSQLGVIIDHEGSGSHDFEDKEYIAVDNTGGPFDGNVYMSWSRFPTGLNSARIMLSRSTDAGNSFSTPKQISDNNMGYQGSVPAVGPDGEVYVVWWRLRRTQTAKSTIEIDKSTDGGITWGQDILVANIDDLADPFHGNYELPDARFKVTSWPTIAVDRTSGPFSGNVYVAWADEIGIGMGPDILFSRSIDGGQTWSQPIRVSDDTNKEYQWFPWMSVDPQGNIDVVFSDRRDAPASTQYHTYHARSTDGGLSFGPNFRVTDVISDSEDSGFMIPFIGDYNGITSTANTVHPFWTDTREGNAEGYTAAITIDLVLTNQTINTTEVFEAINSITAGPNFTIVSPGDVTFRAGKVIRLVPGFTAAKGSQIRASIDQTSK